MKIKIVVLVTMLLNTTAQSQITFEKTITKGSEEHLHSVIQTTDGGYASLATSVAANPGTDIWLVKTNELGDTLWTKTFYGIGEDHMLDRALVQTSDGGYTFIATRNYHANLLHTSSTGDSLWEKELSDHPAYVLSPTSGQGYIVTGSGSTISMLRVSLVSTSGDLVWSREFQLRPSNILAWPNGWAPVREVPDGGFIVAGEIASGYYTHTPYLLRIGPAGDSLWYREYNWLYDASFYSVDTAGNDGFYACGSESMTGTPNTVIMKFNSIGDTTWTRIHQTSGNQYLMSVRTTADGGAIACGSFGRPYPNTDSTQVFLIKYSATGAIQWEKLFGNYKESYGLSVERASDNGYILCGAFQQTSATQQHGLLIKTDDNGNILGMDEPVENRNFSFYPNPAGDLIHFKLTASTNHGETKISLINIYGQFVAEINLPDGRNEVSFPIVHFQAGVYSYLLTNRQFTQTGKLIIIK